MKNKFEITDVRTFIVSSKGDGGDYGRQKQGQTYGKTLLAYRLGIEIGSAGEPWLQPTVFGLECITRYASQLAPLPTGA